MVSVTGRASQLLVQLAGWEKVLACHGDLQLPLSMVLSACHHAHPWEALRGIRAPGSGFPGLLACGVRRYPGGKDFSLLLGRWPALAVELTAAAPYQRLLLWTPDPTATAAALQPYLPD